MVNVGTDPMPAGRVGIGIDTVHRFEGIGGASVVVVEVDMVDIQMGINLLLN